MQLLMIRILRTRASTSPLRLHFQIFNAILRGREYCEMSQGYIPVEALGFTAIITSIFAVYLPHSVHGVPAYARVALLVIGVNNLLKGLKYWLSLPDGGIEDQTRMHLGPPTALRTLTIGLRRKQGQGLVSYATILIYITYYAPQLTFEMLKIHLIKVIVGEITNKIYTPFLHRGKSLVADTPEENGFMVDFFMVAIPLLCSYVIHDVWSE